MQSSKLSYAVVRVPGSTSNIGPGFDCMGIALQIYNHVRVERSVEENVMGVEPAHDMVEAASKAFFEEADAAPFAVRWRIDGEVPISRGLGSSVTLRQGILQGLNTLAGDPLDREALFALGTAL